MRYILFDLYGLFHHVQTSQQFAGIAELIGTDADSLRPLYLGKFRHDYDAGLIDAEQYWRLIGDGLGIEIDWRVALKADNDSWEGVHEDMVELARELHAAGVPIALLSNEPRELTALTRARREWIALFDPVVFSGEVGLAKPDPAIFDLALERMRAVVGGGLQAADVLFTDDSLVNIETARELGFGTHLFEGIHGLRDVVAQEFGGAAGTDDVVALGDAVGTGGVVGTTTGAARIDGFAVTDGFAEPTGVVKLDDAVETIGAVTPDGATRTGGVMTPDGATTTESTVGPLETNDAGNSDTGTSDFVTRDATAVDEPDTASEVSSYESSKESIGGLPADLTGGLVGR